MSKKYFNILITGGAGFIGSHLIGELLDLNHNVICIDNYSANYLLQIKEKNIYEYFKKPNFNFFEIDICDKESVAKIFRENKIDIVIHLAAKTGVRASFDDPFGYIKTNIVGTINLLNAIKKNNVKKIIFASSSSVYGNLQEEKFSEDSEILEPISPYAYTKLACEKILYKYSHTYNFQVICLRFFTVFGPRQRPDLAIRKFVEFIKQDKPIPVYGNGDTIRDYTYITDITAGVISAIDYNKTQYEIINLASGSPKTLLETIGVIEDCLNKKAIIVNLPMQKGDVNRTFADIKKAKELLNYMPKTDFKKGIKNFIKWLEI